MFDIFDQFVGIGKSCVAIRGQRFVDDGLVVTQDVAHARRLAVSRQAELMERSTTKGHLAGKNTEPEGTETVYVTAHIQRLSTCLLRAHEKRRAE